jgi:Zinc finger, C3HC4 type (RING finger)
MQSAISAVEPICCIRHHESNSTEMTSSIPASTLIEQISGELLTCQVCRQSLKRSKTLACRHSFCENCLYDLLSTSVDRHHITCPACQTLSVLPPGGVRRLPDDPVVARLSDVIDRRRKSTTDDDSDIESNRDGVAGRKSCEICSIAHGNNGVTGGRRKVAQSRCLECCKLLCSGCARLHRRTNVRSATRWIYKNASGQHISYVSDPR